MTFFQKIQNQLAEKKIFFTGTHATKTIAVLYPEERKYIANAILKRQEEFATGQWCARQTLKKIGLKPAPLLRRKYNEPLWPKSICGSITHTANAACAVAAYTEQYLSLGIDIEKNDRKISGEAFHFITNEDERKWLKQIEDKKLFFCIKESIFKLISPLVQSRFPLADICLLPFNAKGCFSYRLKNNLITKLRNKKKYQGIYFSDKNWLFVLSYLKS